VWLLNDKNNERVIMKRIYRIILVLCLDVFSVCSFGETTQPPKPPEAVPVAGHVIVGRAFLKAAWKNAGITIKNQKGDIVGVTRTDEYGQYQFILDAKEEPPFIVRAVSANGAEAFGIGNEYIVNVTQLSNLILSKWYGDQRALSDHFHSSDGNLQLPDVNDIQVGLGQFFSEINEYIGSTDYDVLSDVINKDVEKVLQSILIKKDGSVIRVRYRGNVVGQFDLNYTKLASSDSLVISGRNYGREIDGSSDSAKLTKRYNALFYAKIDASRVPSTPSVTSALSQAHDWMSQDSRVIQNKRLAEIAIPGTHDSGTAGIGGDTGHTVAATQQKSIPDQLEDGIRYFDLRADEYSGKSCADGSDFYVFHGDGALRYLSYRFNDVLRGIRNFLDDPSHSKEIIIIDMQQISAGNSGNEAVFFRSVQEMLQPYLMDNRIDSYQWWKNPIGKIWEYNKKNNARGQVILLTQGGWFNPPRSGCSAAMNKNVWLSRDDLLNGFWRGGRQDFSPILDDITAQLSFKNSGKQNRVELFNNYRKALDKGGLNVLNMAPQPSDGTYALWFYQAQFSSKTRDYLIHYSNNEVNYLANITTDGKNSCWSGALGKVGLLANSHYIADPSSGWNPVNVIMVDSYNLSNFWTSVEYDNGFFFKKATSYVDFVRNLNNIKNNYAALPELDEVNLMQCF
jgi:hypothetical protein